MGNEIYDLPVNLRVSPAKQFVLLLTNLSILLRSSAVIGASGVSSDAALGKSVAVPFACPAVKGRPAGAGPGGCS